MEPGVARQRIRGLAAQQELRRQFSASIVSFMAAITLPAQPLWYTASIQVLLANQPLMTPSAGYAGTPLGIQGLGAACHRSRRARRRGATTALWWASLALRPGMPLRVGSPSFRVRSPLTRWSAVYRSPRWWHQSACTVS